MFLHDFTKLLNDFYILPFTNFFFSAIVAVSSGIALEHLIELAITQQADPWINIPVLADDDYVTQLANLLFAKLPSQYSAYIEFSNEIWNQVCETVELPFFRHFGRQGTINQYFSRHISRTLM
jgi:hypothetical protein